MPDSQHPQRPSKSRSTVYVIPPRLSPTQKSQYKDLSLTNEEYPVDEVVSEFSDQEDRKWYYARYQGGIIRAFIAREFVTRHQDLVDAYDDKKVNGLLPDFDPATSKEVHPDCRVSIIMDMERKRVTRLRISSTSSDRYHDDTEPSSESEAVSDSELDADDASSAYDSSPPSRTTRSKLFSPQKTRSRKVIPVDDDDDDDDDGAGASNGLRRSTRSNKGLRIPLDDDVYANDSQSEDDDDISKTSKRKVKSAKLKNKEVKIASPAYGQFRPIEDVAGNDEEPLWAHRQICEKCFEAPAHKLLALLQKRGAKGKRRARNKDPEDSSDEEEKVLYKGGWVRCLKCPVSAHWGCLAKTQQDEILKVTRQRDQEEWMGSQEVDQGADSGLKNLPRRQTLEVDYSTEFICGSCTKGGICMGCMDVALDANPSAQPKPTIMNDGDDGESSAIVNVQHTREGLLFRCLTCKRLAHYEHLQKDRDPDQDIADIAQSHQHNWLCIDCASYQWKLDKILAWRPYPPNAVEPLRAEDEPVNYKSQLPREYLVKWMERGYNRTQWVPHMWLLSTYPQKLRNFLVEGPKVRLLLEPRTKKDLPETEPPTFNSKPNSRSPSAKPGTQTPVAPRNALPDAERRIPLPWMTVDRVLEVELRRPTQYKKRNKRIRKMAEGEEEGEREEAEDVESQAYQNAYDLSEEPEGFTESIDEFEATAGRPFDEDDIGRVIWGFFKWDELGYDEATPDSPPRLGDETYDAFHKAMLMYIASRKVEILKPKKFDESPYGDRRQKDGFRRQHRLKNPEDLDLGQSTSLRLMPFQVDGFNWLCDNWWNRQPCILADEMGLGKTVQITSFLGKIITDFNAAPALVVVPNSTITNWVREFERWAPQLRVVPFYGEARSREVIKTFELYHEDARARKFSTKTKFHVLITTYEAITNKVDFTSVFKSQPRWEVLVIDEGQRLKNDTSLLFKKLNDLNTNHRVIMTGTPLNNNIRELFNLMNFLDPDQWKDLQALEKEHEELTEELVKQLHIRLRPYFLRRIKSEVLQLPPKNEVIVPVSMAPLQKQVYRSILSHNADLLSGLTNPSAASGNPGRKSVNNMLMQLRKCLQHPYLYDRDIEPMNLSLQETHEKLIDASAKLRLLRSLLPKLQNRGHRVLLFSQFVIALDIIEDFLVGEGIKYLRLDGNTPGHERQKGMDAFNAPDSDIFIYLLTTRAGGVGINLFTADTVIIFDPDFNPHQDLQAIARAHRYGQQKTVLVFKLMVNQSAEERIMQVGKKKMVLDHLIVQKMEDDDDAGADVQSILMYGAQTLFEEGEGSEKDIVYTDNDIDKLIEKTEKEGDAEEVPREGAASFTFAKIWTSDKDQLEEVRDENQEDSWAHTLQKINAEMELAIAKEAAQMGRGVRRKATAPVPKVPDEYPERTPKGKKKRLGTHSSEGDSAYNASDTGTGSGNDNESSESNGYQDISLKSNLAAASGVNGLPLVQICGLCGQSHASDGSCGMADSSQNLAEFREMLILHADDEPFEQRVAAIRAIEETLFKRGDLHLIRNQPLHPIPPRSMSFASSAQSTLPLEHQGATSSNIVVNHRKRSGKRFSSPIPYHPAKKPKPQPQSTLCPVCEVAVHLLKDCPIVLRGPSVVLKAIMRLESTPGMSDVTSELRRILKKQKKAQDLERMRDGEPPAAPSRNIIILD